MEIWIFNTEELEDLVILGPLYLRGHSGLRPSGGRPVMKHCWLLASPQPLLEAVCLAPETISLCPLWSKGMPSGLFSVEKFG